MANIGTTTRGVYMNSQKYTSKWSSEPREHVGPGEFWFEARNWLYVWNSYTNELRRDDCRGKVQIRPCRQMPHDNVGQGLGYVLTNMFAGAKMKRWVRNARYNLDDCRWATAPRLEYADESSTEVHSEDPT